MNAIHVCHLITELGQGGAQQALYRYLACADRERYKHNVVCLYNGSAPVADHIKKLGIDVTDLGMITKLRWDRLAQLPGLLRNIGPQILHGWMYHGNMAARLAGRRAHVPIIVTSRRNEYIGGATREWLKRKTAHMDSHVIAVSKAARQAEIECAGVRPAQVTTIHNGIDTTAPGFDRVELAASLRSEFKLPADTQVVAVVGRLHPQKGHESLLKSFARLKESGTNAHLLIIGDGILRAHLEASAQNLGLTGTVTFAGTRGDASQLVAGADVFVLPSRWEGMPNAVLEAMLVGTPIVATRVGGIPELLDSDCGIVVPPCDTDTLTEALARVLSDDRLAQSLAESARARVREHFSISETKRKTEALYAQLVEDKMNLRYVEGAWVAS